MSSMKTFALVFLFSAAFLLLAEARFKRSLDSLAKVIKEYTGTYASDYKDYGCWCGPGGSGAPKDAVDRCCQAHDRCYGRISCLMIPAQAVIVQQSCGGGDCLCLDKAGSCTHQLCTCDTHFGQCLKRAGYNAKYKGKC